MNFKLNDIITLKIIDMTLEGFGLGKLNDFVFFIKNATIGDIITAKISKIHKSFGYADILSFIQKGENRISVDCEYYKSCGGCCFRHINYDEELKVKLNSVNQNLKKIAKIDYRSNKILSSEKIINYRNKCFYHIGLNDQQKIISGFFNENSHIITEIKACLLEPIIFTYIKEKVLIFLNEKKYSVYNNKSTKGLLKGLFIRTSKDLKSVSLGLVINSDTLPFENEFVNYVKTNIKDVTSLFININKLKNQVHLTSKSIILLGNKNAIILDNISNINLKISPNSFYQVNPDATELLYKQIKKNLELKKSDVIFDIYCGTGSIGLFLSDEIKHLYGLDIVSKAVFNAKENAKINKIDNSTFICDDAKNSCNYLNTFEHKPNIIVIDPPRKGCDIKLIKTVVDISPEKIVMVSCNSSTMSRDLQYFLNANYYVKDITCVDMFPRTGNVETVVVLHRKLT
ncbi:MAG: 23S rRNA (uracil(1939)-C(5))-methyltransferase RlmD [Oscillospiraceae bacterium]